MIELQAPVILHRGSNRRAHVLLNLSKELGGKAVKCEAC